MFYITTTMATEGRFASTSGIRISTTDAGIWRGTDLMAMNTIVVTGKNIETIIGSMCIYLSIFYLPIRLNPRGGHQTGSDVRETDPFETEKHYRNTKPIDSYYRNKRWGDDGGREYNYDRWERYSYFPTNCGSINLSCAFMRFNVIFS